MDSQSSASSSKKMTKKDLLSELDQLVSEYLGFETGVYGMKSKPKAEIEAYVAKLRRALVYKQLAAEYRPNAHDGLYQCITGTHSAAHIFSIFLRDVATRLYWGEDEQAAIKLAWDRASMMIVS